MGEAKRKSKAGLMPPNRGQAVDIDAAMLALRQHSGFRGTTPAMPLSQAVRDFVARLSPGQEPMLLPFTTTSPEYETGLCHANVIHRVSMAGGERVNGWMIWENPKYVEAEFHAVWRPPTGELVDLTPRQDGEEFVLFLPDPNTRITEAPPELGVPIVWLPINRTNIPKAPYAYGGRAHHHPYIRLAADVRATRIMKHLGVASIVG